MNARQIATLYAQITGAAPRRRPSQAHLDAALAAAGMHLVPTEGDPPMRIERDQSSDDPILDRVITVLSPQNPKRGKSASHARFALYRTGDTVRQYAERAARAQQVTLGKALADVRWDMDHGYISVTDR